MNQTVFYYDEHAQEYCAATIDADMSFCRDKFMECLPAGAHILDAGCGSGRDSKVFLENGFEVTAMDASGKMLKKLLCDNGFEVCEIFITEDVREDHLGEKWTNAIAKSPGHFLARRGARTN